MLPLVWADACENIAVFDRAYHAKELGGNPKSVLVA